MKSSATSPIATPWATSFARERHRYRDDDEDRRPDLHVPEQPLGVGDPHPDAAVRGRVADRRGVGRAVDPDVRRRDPHPARAERVARARAGPDPRRPPSRTAADTTRGSAACSRSRSSPSGVGNADCPVATPNQRTNFALSKNSEALRLAQDDDRLVELGGGHLRLLDRRTGAGSAPGCCAPAPCESHEPVASTLEDAGLPGTRSPAASTPARARRARRSAFAIEALAELLDVGADPRLRDLDVERDDRAGPRQARTANRLRDVRRALRARSARARSSASSSTTRTERALKAFVTAFVALNGHEPADPHASDRHAERDRCGRGAAEARPAARSGVAAPSAAETWSSSDSASRRARVRREPEGRGEPDESGRDEQPDDDCATPDSHG